MAQQQDRIFIVASTGLAARAAAMTNWGFTPTEAGMVRHFATPNALVNEVKRRRQRGLHVPDVVWYFNDLTVPHDTMQDMRDFARDFGLEFKRFDEHPRHQSYWSSPDVPAMFYTAGYRQRVAEIVAQVDWQMPSTMRKRMRHVRGPEQLYGVQGSGSTIWLMPDFYELGQADRAAVFELAYHRGFETKQYMEHPAYVPRKV